MNGAKPGDRVWIFRSANGGVSGFRNIGKTLLVVREAAYKESGACGTHWVVETLEPCVCGLSGHILPAGKLAIVLKSCVKPLRDPDANSQPTSNLEELHA